MADGSVRKLHHVAVAVESVEQSLGFYRDVLGLTEIETIRLDDRGLHVALIKTGDSEIELLEPTTPDNTVRKFLDRRGPGLHHICFQVDDLERAIQELKNRGAEFVDDVPRPGAVGLVAFMPPSVADGVLVELTQVSSVGSHASVGTQVAGEDLLSPSPRPMTPDAPSGGP